MEGLEREREREREREKERFEDSLFLGEVDLLTHHQTAQGTNELCRDLELLQLTGY